jgi:hypothetical protein
MSEAWGLFGPPRKKTQDRPRLLTADQQAALFYRLIPEFGVSMADTVARACAFGRPQVSICHRRDRLGITVVKVITIDHNILCQTVSDSSVDCLVSGAAAGSI